VCNVPQNHPSIFITFFISLCTNMTWLSTRCAVALI
jgi:hypothetical protein